MDKHSQFDATPSMLGYLYQVRFGLFVSMKKLFELHDPEHFSVSIEKLDDIAFESEGVPQELLQTKYHGYPGNLTDRSPDIWKTIRVWVDAFREGRIDICNVYLALVTTQSLPDGSLASYLSQTQERDVRKALEIMSRVCEEENETNKKGYQAFRGLSEAEKRALLDSIFVIGRTNDLLGIREKMKPIARQSVPIKAIDAFLERVEGVWFRWCVEALSQTPSKVINLGDLQDLIDALRPEYKESSLPPEFKDFIPALIKVDEDPRLFVQQLRLFGAQRKMLEMAIKNYYRAFEQRNKWSSDGLLNPGELKQFDNKLIEKWEEQKAFQEMEEALDSEDNKKKFAQKLYRYCQQEGLINIRPDFVEEFLPKGSYHVLCDQLKIGWHPDFEVLLKASNEDAA